MKRTLLSWVSLIGISILSPSVTAQTVADRAPQLSTDDRYEIAKQADQLAGQAMDLVRSGDLLAALPLYKEALQLSRKALGKRHRFTIENMNNYAFVLMFLDRASEAEPILAETVRLSREVFGERNTDTIYAINNYAKVLRDLGQISHAESYYAEVLRLRRNVLGERHPDTVDSLVNYASILRSLGRPREAEPLYAEALRVRRRIFGKKHDATLSSMTNYASVLLRLDRLDEAEPLYREVLRRREKQHGRKHPDTLLSINNYAAVLERLGRDDEAEALFAEIVPLKRQVLGERDLTTLSTLGYHAYVMEKRGRANEAKPIYERVLRLRREILGDTHPSTLNDKKQLVGVLLQTMEAERALPLSRELARATRSRAIGLSQESLQGNAQFDRELRKRQAIERLLADTLWVNIRRDELNFNAFSIEAYSALQIASANSTSNAVKEAAATRFAAGLGLKTLAQERQALVRKWASIESDLVKKQVDARKNRRNRTRLRLQLDALVTRLEEIDRRLASDAPQYSLILNQHFVDLKLAKQILRQDEAVLFLVPTERGTHAMALTKDDIAWNRAPITGEALSIQIHKFRNGLEIEVGDAFLPSFDLEQAYDLYKQLIAPVESVLQRKSRVYVVADGALSRLPLGTLVTSPPLVSADPNDPAVLRATNWLADRYALAQLPSLQSLYYIRKFGDDGNTGNAAGFKGFGDPILEGESRLRSARSATIGSIDATSLIGNLRGNAGVPLMDPAALRKLPKLPGTRSELEQVRKALGAPMESLYLAEKMTEPAIRSADFADTRILHLATHGFTSEESGDAAEPGLVFTPPTQARPENDGYLAASEVVGIDLSAANWVILSACNTAAPSSSASQTGLSGLAHAFFYAGAKSLLVSHWPVFDDIAPILTVDALKRSQAGMPRAEALQAAMKMVRHDPNLDAAHPAVWAPFAIVGEGR